MKMKFAMVAVFFLLYSIFVIALMPAQFLLTRVNVPNNIQISGVSGTIWQTKIAQVRVNDIVIDNINSQLSLVSLLTFDPTFAITFGKKLTSAPVGQLQLSGLLSDLTLKNVDISAPANLALARFNLMIEVEAHNQLNLQVEQYTLGKPICQQLTGQLLWHKAAITAIDQTVQLGKISADLTCQQGEIVAIVAPKNNLGLSYTAKIKGNGRFNGQGYIKPGVRFPAKLRQVLSFLGQPDAKGRYPLKG